MCDTCKSKPFYFRGDKHKSTACPFKMIKFCTLCSVYGHICPVINTNRSELKEQISSPPMNPFIEMKDNSRVIKAFLVSRCEIGPRVENATLLKETLIEYVKRENKRLLLLE